MANYFTDFSEYGLGSVAGWTQRWATQNYQIASVPAATGGKVLRASGIAGNNRSLISWDLIDSDTDRDDCEILARIRSDKNDTPAVGVFAGVASRASAVGGQTAYIHTSTGSVFQLGHAIGRFVSGASTFPTAEPFSQNWDGGVFYWHRFRLNGDTQKAKRWAGNLSDEPASWQIEETNGSITSPGWVGMFTFAYDQNNFHELDLFAVGTGGDPALIPSLLATPRRRRQFAGYGL